LVGWKLIGYPGSQPGYSDANMAIGFDQSSVTIVTLSDLEGFSMPLPNSGY
jgi:hypothetical protein